MTMPPFSENTPPSDTGDKPNVFVTGPGTREPTPSMGRVVRVKLGGEECPATIARVWSPTCLTLSALDRNGVTIPLASVDKATDPGEEGKWWWPARG